MFKGLPITKILMPLVGSLLFCASSITTAVASDNDEDQRIISILGAYDAGEYERAKTLCNKLLTAHPKSLTGHYLLGNVLVKLYQLNDAEAAYKYCLKGGKSSAEANYAYQALEHIYEQRRNATATQSSVPTQAPTQEQRQDRFERDEEMRTRLEQEAKDKLAVKQKVLDDKIAQVERDLQTNLYNSPRGRFGRFYRQEYQDQVKADAKAQIDRLKSDFAREEEEINQACRKRLEDLAEYERNIEARRRH